MRLILLFLCFTACTAKTPKVWRLEQSMMQMPLCIQLRGELSSQREEAVDTAICETFAQIDKIYNIFNPTSEVSLINRAPAWTPLLLSEELAHFLSCVEQYVKQTEGRFDPTVSPLQKLWLKHLKEGELPPPPQCYSLSKAIGWERLCLSHRILYKRHAQTAIDLSGIAKGLAVDRLVERLEALGFEEIYVEWGGEIATRGCHPSGRPWTVAIFGSETTVELQHAAIATSGNYHQKWDVKGVTYSHILDPKTKQPLVTTPQGISSVSVVAENCCLADMLATTLMLFETTEEAERWCHAHFPDARIWLLTSLVHSN